MGTKREESRRGIDGIVSVAFASRENSCLSGLPWFGGMGGGCQCECGEPRSDTQTHAFSSTTCLPFNKQLFPPHTSAMAHCNEMIKAVLRSWTSLFRVRSKDLNMSITASIIVNYTVKRKKWVILVANRLVGSASKE